MERSRLDAAVATATSLSLSWEEPASGFSGGVGADAAGDDAAGGGTGAGGGMGSIAAYQVVYGGRYHEAPPEALRPSSEIVPVYTSLAPRTILTLLPSRVMVRTAVCRWP